MALLSWFDTMVIRLPAPFRALLQAARPAIRAVDALWQRTAESLGPDELAAARAEAVRLALKNVPRVGSTCYPPRGVVQVRLPTALWRTWSANVTDLEAHLLSDIGGALKNIGAPADFVTVEVTVGSGDAAAVSWVANARAAGRPTVGQDNPTPRLRSRWTVASGGHKEVIGDVPVTIGGGARDSVRVDLAPDAARIVRENEDKARLVILKAGFSIAGRPVKPGSYPLGSGATLTCEGGEVVVIERLSTPDLPQ